jgi:hypothetical protein
MVKDAGVGRGAGEEAGLAAESPAPRKISRRVGLRRGDSSKRYSVADKLALLAKPECEVTTGPNLGAGSGWLTVNGARDYRSGVRRTPKAATCHYSTPSCIRARRTYGFGVASLHRFALAERPGSTRSRVATTPAAWQSSVPAAEHGGECRQRPLWGCATPCEPSAIHRADRRSGRASQT